MNIFAYLKIALKKYFLSGILVIVPLIITYVVLKFLLSSVDGILSPLLIKYLGYDIPGLGIVITLLLILITGFLTRGIIGKAVVTIWEKFLTTLPLVRPIYSAAKQLMATVAEPKESMFQRVVIVPYPRDGSFALAFAASEVKLDNRGVAGNYVAVFVPSTPTPFTGFVVMFKKEEVIPTDISVEEAVKFFVSGGIALPASLSPRALKDIHTS